MNTQSQNESQRIFPTEITRQTLLDKCDYFSDVQLWPIQSEINPVGWLKNFTDDEQKYAIQLLNGFLFFNEMLINQMFKSAFHNLCNKFTLNQNSFLKSLDTWQLFRNSVIITYVTGEDPNPSDSGIGFARKARQQWKIEQDNIKTPEEALNIAYHKDTPIVFVDDFVGSGSQFITTWERKVPIGPSTRFSFSQIAKLRAKESFYYCPLIVTEYGLNKIQDKCPEVIISPAHILSKKYSVFSQDSILWPKGMAEAGINFVREASKRAGIPDDPNLENHWQGFHNLGLTIAFHNSVPDASLPIFYWNQNGWVPLIQRK